MWIDTFLFTAEAAHPFAAYADMCRHHQTSPLTPFTQGRFCSVAVADLGALLGRLQPGADYAALARQSRGRLGRATLSGAERTAHRLALAGLDEGILPFSLPNSHFIWRIHIRGTNFSDE